MSVPSCHDGAAWLCAGALCLCICHQPPESVTACQKDDSVIADGNVTSKVTD